MSNNSSETLEEIISLTDRYVPTIKIPSTVNKWINIFVLLSHLRINKNKATKYVTFKQIKTIFKYLLEFEWIIKRKCAWKVNSIAHNHL